MTDPNLEDHVVGLELQLVELVERAHRAEVQGMQDEVAELQPEIQRLQSELASSVEQLSPEDPNEARDRPVVQADPVGDHYSG